MFLFTLKSDILFPFPFALLLNWQVGSNSPSIGGCNSVSAYHQNDESKCEVRNNNDATLSLLGRITYFQQETKSDYNKQENLDNCPHQVPNLELTLRSCLSQLV